MNNKTPGPDSASKQRRLRILGVAVLLLGIGGAGFVYWLGTRSPNVMDDISMVGFNRAQSRQMGTLFGKSGLMIEELANDLKQPGTQAEIIVGVSILVAAGCFYFAQFKRPADTTAGDSDLHPRG